MKMQSINTTMPQHIATADKLSEADDLMEKAGHFTEVLFFALGGLTGEHQSMAMLAAEIIDTIIQARNKLEGRHD
jgi:hypothetical protein